MPVSRETLTAEQRNQPASRQASYPSTRINGSPETVFDLIADLPNYGRWLPGSVRCIRF
jgi:hypothetical protein